MEKVMVPKLRFPEFGNEWETIKFKDFCFFQRGFDLTEKNRKEGEVPVISSSGIAYWHNIAKVEGPGIVTGRKGIVGKVFYTEGDFWPHDTTLWVKDYYSNSLKYVYQFLLRFDLKKYDASTSVPTLNRNNIHGIKIQIPSLPEQQKIATFLGKVDEKISALEEKKRLLEQYKKGVMQQLFSQQIRFKDEDGNDFPAWEEKKIKDVGKVVTGNTPSTKNQEYYNGDYFFVSPFDIGSKRFILKTKTTLTKQGFSKGRIIPKDSVLFVCIGSTIGKVGQASRDCITNQQINSVISHVDSSPHYLFFLLEKNALKIKKLAGEQAVPLINKTDFENIKLPFPTLPEQQKIASFLSAIDDKIAGVGEQLAQSRAFKKGLLQGMFV
ncbi:restriction endonuclease subunit S [Persicobacter diffluens]|uniref:Type I site-specific deoxyribonuclease specificity subunit n=1 Tax=Persicobacter diffluens TaxID=981 RepID=A0AAN5AME7_9BACT|nr:type I site-specific deoxyribonuclease specificity subunit [Persicobacter diffluens]